MECSIRWSRCVFPIFIVFAGAIAGCGGGGGGSFVTGTLPTATPHAGPTTIPATATPQLVTISGAGYTLSFTLPAVTTGNASTVSAALVASPPPGVPAVAIKRRANTGGSPNGLVYLTLSSSAAIGFADLPSFTWTLPSPSVIPSGDPAYMAYYDPAVGQWYAALGPGSLSASTLTFPGVSGGLSFAAGTQYVYALIYTAQAVPTASPAPTPTAIPASAPAYCSSYSSNTSSGAVALNLTDDSGLSGSALVVYIENATASPARYMDNAGNFTQSSPYPIPAACFSTTSGSVVSGKPLNIPAGVGGGRIYFAYAPAPSPSSTTVPNPFATYSTFNPPYQYTPFPWDKIEYSTLAGFGPVIDTTQVDFMGLPLELSLGGSALPHQSAGNCPTQPSGVVGVSSCGFAQVFSQISANANYAPLVVQGPYNGQNYDLRVIAPKDAFDFTSFQWNMFDLASFAPQTAPCTATNTASNGYLGCVLASYQAQPRLFTSSVGGASGSGHWYCASSDGTSNFIFTDIGTPMPSPSPGTCSSATPAPNPQMSANPFKMPISMFTQGQPPAQDTAGATVCENNELFGQPYGLAYVNNNPNAPSPTGNLFQGSDAFAMWKALVADLNYGTALSTTSPHPVGQFAPVQMSSFWQDPMYSNYAYILHSNFDNNLAYALAYDDVFSWESGLLWQSGESINVRINAIPTTTVTSASPVPVATPASCPTITAPIGSY